MFFIPEKNREGFIEITSLDTNGGGYTFPTLVAVKDIQAITSLEMIDQKMRPGGEKANAIVKLRGADEAIITRHRKSEIVEMLREV